MRGSGRSSPDIKRSIVTPRIFFVAGMVFSNDNSPSSAISALLNFAGLSSHTGCEGRFSTLRVFLSGYARATEFLVGEDALERLLRPLRIASRIDPVGSSAAAILAELYGSLGSSANYSASAY